MTAAALALATPALAVSPEDAVDGHPGVTYGVLLKQIAPDLAKDDKDIWTLSGIKNLRGMGAPSNQPLAEEISFSDLTVQHVLEDGHKRILLFSGDPAGDAFDTLMAVYDDEAKTPKLLDYMNAGGDRFNNVDKVFSISANTDMFVVMSWHDNSSQSYELYSPLYLRGGKIQGVTTLFAFGNNFCTYKETQGPSFTTRPGKPYYALNISVTIERTLNEGRENCGDEAKKPPKPGKRVISDTYRWNGKTFVPTTKAIENLSDANFKANSE